MKRVPYMMNISKVQADLIDAFVASNPNQDSFERAELFKFAEEQGFSGSAAYTLMKQMPRVARGVYQMVGSGNVIQMNAPLAAPVALPQVEQTPIAKAVAKVQSTSSEEVYIPSADPTFVKWGYFADVLKIVKSNMFYPMYVAGLSGNGKTMMIEQACANAKREYVRVQITPETDEDDLIGGFRLLNGETVFAKGPVIKAMEAGALLMIDEIDRGSNKLMCLQGVLEGKPVLIKKTGEVITPAPGFNVIATANTKGQGDEQGRFIAATIIDEAFLERFTITLEQPYPTAATEKRIVTNHMSKFGANDKEFTEKLVQWAQAIRKTFEDGGIDEIISTRRLCHIVQTFSIFSDRMKAIELCVNRFDADTRAAFLDLYSKIDADVTTEEPIGEEIQNTGDNAKYFA
jgi:MoxR-like ATPase|tara:strand:+ start:2428 stop:3636 length:1209 start_codon:yes stop_codon:yes gene_type:complete